MRTTSHVVVLLVAMVMAVVAASWLVARPPAIVMPRIATGIPGLSAHERSTAATDSSCIECHGDVVAKHRASPHGRTLARIDAGAATTLATARRDDDALGRFIERDSGAWLEHPHRGAPLPVQWLFGSGMQARTPVTTWLDPDGRTVMLEHALSWYPPGFLDATLGTEAMQSRGGLAACGKLLDPETTRACFGCHASLVPARDGRIDEGAVVVGVGCVRCHPGGHLHATAMTRGGPDPAAGGWKRLSPLESIRACGECHRRDDQLPPEDIRPDNTLIVRFAPVGLAQSACFTRQSDHRFDCLTCHDPHGAATRRAATTTERCVGCHGDASSSRKCSSAPLTSDCTTCHMPAVEVQPHLSFTDHWIRIRPATRSHPGE